MSDKRSSLEVASLTPAAAKEAKAEARRGFIKKAAVSSIIISLPSRSVWGACSVSGVMSGNLSQNTDRHNCDMPIIPNGRSPGYWKPGGKYHGAFTKYKNRHEGCLEKEIIGFQAATNMFDPELSMQDLENLMSFNAYAGGFYNIGNALRSNGDGEGNIYFHLAAVYLNFYYGIYAKQAGSAMYPAFNPTMAARYVSQILLYVSQNPGSMVNWNMNIEGTKTDARLPISCSSS